MHVNAQLVDTRTDAGIWAEEYDRDLNDVFAIETEVAQSIANRLRAKVSAREQAPYKNDRPKILLPTIFMSAPCQLSSRPIVRTNPKEIFQAVDLLNQAIARDPDFLLAECGLAKAHDWLYLEHDRTPLVWL